MKTFAENIVDQLLEKYSDGISDLCIVLPNRRAGLYLKKHLSARLSKPIWSPLVLSSEDFIAEISGLQSADDLTLLFELFQVHTAIEKEKASSFDEFLPWGQVLLQDFNDVDLYLADAENLYEYLSESKAMSLWNPDGKPLTEFQQNYLRFYRSFKDYYLELNKRLQLKNIAYQGLAFRKTSETIAELSRLFKWNKIIFAGFNALTLAEEKIITTLLHQGKAEFIPDADEYYLNDSSQEAGKFLRKYRSDWAAPFFNHVEINYKTNKKIRIIGVSKNIAQVKLAGEIIEREIDTSEYENTAVVLSDENLLVPLLNSVPEVVKEFNITMGYPLKNVSLFRLFDSLLTMHENASKNSSSKNKTQPSFYFKEVVAFFRHPVIISAISIGRTNNEQRSVSEKILLSNKVFISFEEIQQILEDEKTENAEIFLSVFKSWDGLPAKAIFCFQRITELLRDHFLTSKKEGDLTPEYLYHFSIIFNKLQRFLDETDNVQQLITLKLLFRQMVNTTKLPFFGEPLKGLQIMGMLETRVLDFKNIILLSANEGILPAGKSSHSFIPTDIKFSFHLPTYRDGEAVFSYHFYRLLQRAENITIIYNTDCDTLGNGERSRFISQLQHELPLYNSNISIEEKVLNISTKFDLDNTVIEIAKTDEIIRILENKAKTGFSPSVLNQYIKCPLQFYFSAVAGLQEADEVEETIDAATLGTVVHQVLEDYFTPFLNKNITVADIKKMIQDVETNTRKAFRKTFKNGNVDYGKNHLILKVAIKFLQNFLFSEIKHLEQLDRQGKLLNIKGIEVPLESVITVNINGEEKTIKLKGKADRIDLSGDTCRIIDYKTGSMNNLKLSLGNWDDLISDNKYDKYFQLLTYAWLFLKQNPSVKESVQSGIIGFRKISQGFQRVVIPDDQENISLSNIEQFEKEIKLLIAEIFNIEISFAQTEDEKACNYCAYKNICNR